MYARPMSYVDALKFWSDVCSICDWHKVVVVFVGLTAQSQMTKQKPVEIPKNLV